MKILVTGAAGMLASEIIPRLIEDNHQLLQVDLNQRLPDIKKLDVADTKSVFSYVEHYRPEYIFHLAAETNVDLCEKNHDHALRANYLGTENLVYACQRYNIKLLYISTAGVFWGDKKEPYTEFDQPNPRNFYGQSKLQGEYVVQKLLNKYFIIRAGWMVGGWEIDKKFVYKIIQQIQQGKRQLRVVSDKFGSPTFTKDFASNVMKVINTNRYGIYHMTNQGTCSRYEIALKIVEYLDMKNHVEIIPINSSEFPLPAPRADSEMLRNYKLDLLGINDLPHWEESLKDYINTNQHKIEAISSLA
ncbi:MAG: dTDP-4-dehydrorhamnose reductase [Candidatus Omnitrophica bacterium]|nr:dTDP-4-dehydrorhamnose reductase [Candidatus Omnitrophota bacterium]MCB9748185.1 dTDP-4-dehydrorhamnose reductase [Candidatus Omnitrophota bacterium]